MFTTPDNADAEATCPPFTPPGPVPEGFFKDCQTIPTAEDFNELIVNLRALVAKANEATRVPMLPLAKGWEELLWRSVLEIGVIDYNCLVQVETPANGGTPYPAHPETGDPFDSLDSALTWASRYRIAHTGNLDIRVGPGTYVHHKPIVIAHPDGARIDIIGTGSTTPSLLSFLDGNGVVVKGHLKTLSGLQIHGNNQTNTTGLEIAGGHVAFSDGLDVRFWGSAAETPAYGTGVRVHSGGSLFFYTLTVQDISSDGLAVHGNATVTGVSFTGNRIGLVNAPITSAAVGCFDAGTAAINSIATFGTYRGVAAEGNGAQVRVGILNVRDSINPAAVQALSGGAILHQFVSPGDVGSWSTWNVTSNTPQYFYADVYGLIRADHAFTAANLANCSPAANVVGNHGSFIYAT